MNRPIMERHNRIAPVTTKGSALGCDVCGTYDRECAAALIHYRGEPLPRSICLECAGLLFEAVGILSPPDRGRGPL